MAVWNSLAAATRELNDGSHRQVNKNTSSPQGLWTEDSTFRKFFCEHQDTGLQTKFSMSDSPGGFRQSVALDGTEGALVKVNSLDSSSDAEVRGNGKDALPGHLCLLSRRSS